MASESKKLRLCFLVYKRLNSTTGDNGEKAKPRIGCSYCCLDGGQGDFWYIDNQTTKGELQRPTKETSTDHPSGIPIDDLIKVNNWGNEDEVEQELEVSQSQIAQAVTPPLTTKCQ